jgi:flagellar hook protein FlgE
MNSLLTISASGMQAAQTAARASAHNVANLSTAGFRREQVSFNAAAGGGVTATVSRATVAGNALETDVVGQLAAKNQFLANLAVFKTGDQLMGSLLDVTR